MYFEIFGNLLWVSRSLETRRTSGTFQYQFWVNNICNCTLQIGTKKNTKLSFICELTSFRFCYNRHHRRIQFYTRLWCMHFYTSLNNFDLHRMHFTLAYGVCIFLQVWMTNLHRRSVWSKKAKMSKLTILQNCTSVDNISFGTGTWFESNVVITLF